MPDADRAVQHGTGWVRVAEAQLPAEGEMCELTLAGVRVVLARSAGWWVAFQARCPHASADLVEGALRSGFVICALHAYRFDLKSGRCLKPQDGPRLKLFPVEWRDGALWVKVGG